MFGFYLNMKVCLKDNTNFTSKRLYPVKIPKVDGEFVYGYVSLLKPSNKFDRAAIEQIYNTWPKEYIKDAFYDSFTGKKRGTYLCVEIDRKGLSLGQRIVGISKSKKTSYGNYELCLLATKPEFGYGNKENRQLKYIGQILLGAVIKKAQIFNLPKFTVSALWHDSEDFYRKIFYKLNIDYDSFYRIFNVDKEEFLKYLNYWKENFRINYRRKLKFDKELPLSA